MTKAPVLISPNFTKDFIIFSFDFEHTVAAVLLHKKDDGFEQPISFCSKALRDAALKYNIMEKQSFSLIKAIKDFRMYILHSNIVAYVPNAVLKDILTQNGPDGKRGRWIAILVEYDMEIKPTNLIKGQGLAKLMVESNLNALDINFVVALDDQEEKETPQLDEAFMTLPWYAYLIFVLFNLNDPPCLTKTNSRFLNLKGVKFFIIDNILYWKHAGGILLKCLLKDNTERTK